MQSANWPSTQTVLPQHHTVEWHLCLLSIMRPKTKYHPLLASATRFPPVSSSSHGRRAKERECIMGANAFIQPEVQLTQCVTTVVDAALLTLSHAAAPWKSKSQSTARELLSTAGTHSKLFDVRRKYQIPYRTKNCTISQRWIMSKNTAEAQKTEF